MANTFSKMYHGLLQPVGNRVYVYFFLLNLVSNSADLFIHRSLKTFLMVVAVSAFWAYAESAVVRLARWKWLRRTLIAGLALFHNVLLVTDYYLMGQFDTIFNQDIIDILAETNPVEVANFAETYLHAVPVAGFLLVVALLNVCLYGLSRLLNRAALHLSYGFLTVAGAVVYAFLVVNFALYRDGANIPQYHAATRAGYSYYTMLGRSKKIALLRQVCRNLKVSRTTDDKPVVVVVIGESASVYHSQLYGYPKATQPRLAQRAAGEGMVVFDNVVSVSHSTHGAMKSIFSLDSLGNGFNNLPLFPACFKAAGCHTEMYDNQYFVGQGITFLSDAGLSAAMFDRRNAQRFQYDGEMVSTISPRQGPALYVIHLWGQHYTYAERFPAAFRQFKADDYPTGNTTQKQRQIMANYDNATLYNDYVLDQVIRRFEHGNACVVYFSDHGEEVYELGGFMGHGQAEHSADLRYQIRVPMLVWMSATYRQQHPETYRNLLKRQHEPAMTDDVAHLILDLGGLRTAAFKPQRSLASNRWRKRQQRIVLTSIDYDKYNRK